jgi:hypothetical protein
MHHSWTLTVRCDQCPHAQYKLQIPVLRLGWGDKHPHCTSRQMKEMLDPARDELHDDCQVCHPEKQPVPVITWKGRKTPIGVVWSMKMIDGRLHIELERPRKKRASPRKRS